MKRFLLLPTLLLMLANSSVAHQQKVALTKLLFNTRTQNIEVMHRFYLHDAEHAVQMIYGGDADIIASEQTQLEFSQYVGERFGLYDGETPLALQSVGYEIDGLFFWVYQEVAIPAALDTLWIHQEALRDLWPSQYNLVNIEGLSERKSLSFSGDDTLLEVRIGETPSNK